MDLTEKTAKINYVFNGKIINVRRDDAVLPDGRTCFRELVEHPGGACVLCVVDGKVPLVRQYRYAYQRETLEVPAGKLNKGEDPKLSAIRELKEETGLVADDAKLLFTLYPSPGYTNEIIHIYYAEGVERGEQALDDGEFLNVEYYDFDKALSLVENGEICDSKTIVALQWYAVHKK